MSGLVIGLLCRAHLGASTRWSGVPESLRPCSSRVGSPPVAYSIFRTIERRHISQPTNVSEFATPSFRLLRGRASLEAQSLYRCIELRPPAAAPRVPAVPVPRPARLH